MDKDYPHEIDNLLNRFHNSAANANFEDYFACFSPDGSFLGTDGSENWSIPEFKEYSRPHFQGDSAWVYIPVVNSRKCKCFPSNTTPSMATFDELLTAPSMKIKLRGSGVLTFDSQMARWTILSYHLSFSIPDDAVPDIDRIVGNHLKTVRGVSLERLEAEASRAAADLLKELDSEDVATNAGHCNSKKGAKKKKKK